MDVELEREIDGAGRDFVFAIMRASGWYPGDAAPKWVWRLAVQEAHKVRAPQPA